MKFHHQKLQRFTQSLFEAMGCPSTDAEVVADVLIAAELRGIPSHGLMRVKDYYAMVKAERINTSPQVRATYETPSTATVDGDNALGPVAAKKSMQIAIEKAKVAGTGWVATNNSNHYGIAGYYSMMALEHDMIGISLTNANPLVAPTYSAERLLGTNPIAVAIPTQNEPPFIADFATTPIARGKLAIKSKLGESVPIGLVQDKEGSPSSNPGILEQGGAILTLGGGGVDLGGHKGYCMTALVDIFSSVLSGANFGPFVPPQVAYLPLLEQSVGKGLGHFFGAIRIDAFRPAVEFKKSMDTWIHTFRTSKSADFANPVQIPGDNERKTETAYLKDGVPVISKIFDELCEIADALNVEQL
ncbi:MAG: Ldh family oxidoreductase [Tenuifilaceae bacterium]|nr:Ldh family oxidoreductase [Tenuifilaceae bacterium]